MLISSEITNSRRLQRQSLANSNIDSDQSRATKEFNNDQLRPISGIGSDHPQKSLKPRQVSQHNIINMPFMRPMVENKVVKYAP